MKYIRNPKPVEGCIFCSAASEPASPQNLVIAQGVTAFVILNRYPYTSGHLMVVPFEHVPSHEDLTPKCRAEKGLISALIWALPAALASHLMSIFTWCPGGWETAVLCPP